MVVEVCSKDGGVAETKSSIETIFVESRWGTVHAVEELWWLVGGKTMVQRRGGGCRFRSGGEGIWYGFNLRAWAEPLEGVEVSSLDVLAFQFSEAELWRRVEVTDQERGGKKESRWLSTDESVMTERDFWEISVKGATLVNLTPQTGTAGVILTNIKTRSDLDTRGQRVVEVDMKRRPRDVGIS